MPVINLFEHSQATWRNPPGRTTALLLSVALLGACQAPPARMQDLAASHGFAAEARQAAGFELTVFRHNSERRDGRLHIYLEGDGSPWQYRVFTAADPTPRSPLMLKLMALDQRAAAYVGRPCYNGSAADPGCENSLWTSARYSHTVVDSMERAIRRLMQEQQTSELWLFGHSGGGALALLLAERLGQAVDGVVTLAGNLDTERWISHHGYTPLYGSLNPARQSRLPDDLIQWHLLGGRDEVVPPSLVLPWIRRQAGAVGVLFERFDHGCCWQSIWRRVLADVDQRRLQLTPGERIEGGGPLRAPLKRRSDGAVDR